MAKYTYLPTHNCLSSTKNVHLALPPYGSFPKHQEKPNLHWALPLTAKLNYWQ